MRHASRSRPGRAGPGGPSQRQLRAGEVVRHALAEVLVEEEVQDPDLHGVSVTVSEVRMSPDLKVATCYVEPLGANARSIDPEPIVAALNRAARFLRGRLSGRVELRFTPELRFRHDTSFDDAAAIDEVFARPEVRRDLEARQEDDEA